MVTVIDYQVRESKKGDTFTTLSLQGDLEMILSQNSGKYYATARKASIITTFNEQACKTLVGTTLPGRIEKQPVDKPYDYQIPGSDEVIKLDYTYEFNPEPANVEETVFA
jgi:hypothetical protein